MPKDEADREEDSRAMRWERPDPGVALAPGSRKQVSSQLYESIHSLSFHLFCIGFPSLATLQRLSHGG